MELHVREFGQGDRVAILLHGMMGSSDSWWRVTPSLVDRGYRVLAMGLPGALHSVWFSHFDEFLTLIPD